MAKIYDIPQMVLASYVLFWFGFLFHFIGFVSPNWYSYSQNGNTTIYGGLWKTCNDIAGCEDVLDSNVESYMEATQTFETFAFLIILTTAATFTIKVYKFKNKTDKYTWIIIGLLFVSCFFATLGFIIFSSSTSTKIRSNVGFAFDMTIVSSLFLVLSGFLYVQDATK